MPDRRLTNDRLQYILYDEYTAFDQVHRQLADELVQLRRLVADFVDPDDCWFDHHGGCQAHGYLSLEPGEICPHEEAKQYLAEVNADA
ncbi:hypothetical protein [Nocardia sp. NPDC057455]|uniref:hypothetical protein n=1 Tax=Nocardia sp. NPDC057455 TaxID=3346138 RepID=UPI00366AA405